MLSFLSVPEIYDLMIYVFSGGRFLMLEGSEGWEGQHGVEGEAYLIVWWESKYTGEKIPHPFASLCKHLWSDG